MVEKREAEGETATNKVDGGERVTVEVGDFIFIINFHIHVPFHCVQQ